MPWLAFASGTMPSGMLFPVRIACTLINHFLPNCSGAPPATTRTGWHTERTGWHLRRFHIRYKDSSLNRKLHAHAHAHVHVHVQVTCTLSPGTEVNVAALRAGSGRKEQCTPFPSCPCPSTPPPSAPLPCRWRGPAPRQRMGGRTTTGSGWRAAQTGRSRRACRHSSRSCARACRR